MNKSLTRTLALIGLFAGIPGALLLVFGIVSHMSPAASQYEIGLDVTVAATLCIGLAWIGALYKTASLRRWGWFASLLCFSAITLFVYSFTGPETAAS